MGHTLRMDADENLEWETGNEQLNDGGPGQCPTRCKSSPTKFMQRNKCMTRSYFTSSEYITTLGGPSINIVEN
jgi:hypothetical protein